MSEASDKRTAPKLSVPERMTLAKELAPIWDPEWIAKQEGFDEGFDEGRAEVLDIIRERLYCALEARSDPEMFGRLTKHLDRISDPELLLKISEQIHEDTTCATLLEWLEYRS